MEAWKWYHFFRLDELPEFSRNVLEVMRQPLEDRIISISRAKYSTECPASFMLVASMTPSLLHKYAEPNAAGLEKLRDAMDRMNMSARAYDRILKVARTIADLEGVFKQLISLKFLRASAHRACADVLDHHSRGAHQPTATSTAPPTSALQVCNFTTCKGRCDIHVE